jgi:hypothetical protein
MAHPMVANVQGRDPSPIDLARKPNSEANALAPIVHGAWDDVR